jgi:hypothetical protein
MPQIVSAGARHDELDMIHGLTMIDQVGAAQGSEGFWTLSLSWLHDDAMCGRSGPR